ncbi:hypothetical protein [Jannaschia marina]|uniref:hypothetical protein n=1 Tax=Jannaschia marina TaxID=2741674 RepID=UPI0015C8CA1F|nr:hypothetical protein [Jannaschia marina]
MDTDQTTDDRITLRELLTAGPTRTIAAAGLLGLMWGPILAGVLDAADRVSAGEAAPGDLDAAPALAAETPPPDAEVVVDPEPATPDITLAEQVAHDDAALDRLQSLTRAHALSNIGRDESARP